MAATHFNPRDKRRIQAWARDLFDNTRPFYVVDTETTGLSKQDEIIQIGVVNRDGETVLDTLVKPSQRVPSGASQVNGIYDHMLADAPTFLDIYVKLSSTLAGQTIIAYNVDFDWRLLNQTATRYRLPPIRVKDRQCAMKQYAMFQGQWNARRGQYRYHKLTAACVQQRIKVANAHTAVGDCLMTLALIKRMAEDS